MYRLYSHYAAEQNIQCIPPWSQVLDISNKYIFTYGIFYLLRNIGTKKILI